MTMLTKNLLTRRLLVSVVSTLLLWPVISMADDKADDAKKLADVEAAIQDINRQLNDIKVQRSDLEKQLETSEKNINDTMKRVEDLRAQIQAKEKATGALTKGKKN